ncbi:MAG TPA: NADP-dependent oxidoreductase [Acidimicrobiia bacterium]|nr:NADP-dependent oxidoreductase [Acidimicrobiia bacterium]
MKAIRIHEPKGLEGIDGLVYEEAPDPTPKVGDALVKVHAAGFTPTELTWPLWNDRNGHDRAPLIPAHEGSGVVVELGFGTTGVAVGDEVYGLIDGYRDGWAAEYVIIETRDVAPKPRSVDHVHAAAIPQAALTSWQALFDHGHLEAGQTVVVHGAAGSVGSMAVQLARNAGAHVVGTGHGTARDLVLELGADRFVDLDDDRWEDAVGQVDVVFDPIGGEILARSDAIVRPGGTLVSVTYPSPTERDDIRTVHFVREPSGAQLVEVARIVDEGRVRPQVGAVYALADARDAFMAKSTKSIPGKVVLEV